MKDRIALGVVLVLGAWGGAASAHHSFAMFDATQTKTLVGTVKQVQWTNPHIWIQVLVPDAKAGAAAEWSIEGGSPNGLTRQGWRRTSIKEGDGTVLDHSLILFGSNMGNSNQHLHYDTPAVLIGGASGRLKGDRYLPYASRTVPTGNLMLSILGMFDVRAERFGDSTGPLQNI